jgi:hypothetical protein
MVTGARWTSSATALEGPSRNNGNGLASTVIPGLGRSARSDHRPLPDPEPVLRDDKPEGQGRVVFGPSPTSAPRSRSRRNLGPVQSDEKRRASMRPRAIALLKTQHLLTRAYKGRPIRRRASPIGSQISARPVCARTNSLTVKLGSISSTRRAIACASPVRLACIRAAACTTCG